MAVDAMIWRARSHVAAFVNGRRPEEIAFGVNATSFDCGCLAELGRLVPHSGWTGKTSLARRGRYTAVPMEAQT